MDHFTSLLPEGMSVLCLEDLPIPRRLLAYKLKVSCVKANEFQ